MGGSDCGEMFHGTPDTFGNTKVRFLSPMISLLLYRCTCMPLSLFVVHYEPQIGFGGAFWTTLFLERRSELACKPRSSPE